MISLFLSFSKIYLNEINKFYSYIDYIDVLFKKTMKKTFNANSKQLKKSFLQSN